jgi:hypothetical protein
MIKLRIVIGKYIPDEIVLTSGRTVELIPNNFSQLFFLIVLFLHVMVLNGTLRK